MNKYSCVVIKNGKVENIQMGNEEITFNHLKNVASQYIDENGVSQIVILMQHPDGKIETMYEWIPE